MRNACRCYEKRALPQDPELMKESEKPKGMGKGDKVGFLTDAILCGVSCHWPNAGERQGQGIIVGPLAIRMDPWLKMVHGF